MYVIHSCPGDFLAVYGGFSPFLNLRKVNGLSLHTNLSAVMVQWSQNSLIVDNVGNTL